MSWLFAWTGLARSLFINTWYHGASNKLHGSDNQQFRKTSLTWWRFWGNLFIMKYDNLTLIFILLLMIVRCGCVQYLVSTGWNPRDHWDLLLRGWLSWDSDMITWSPFPPLTFTRSCKDNLHLSIIHTARLGYLDDGNTRGLKNLANNDFYLQFNNFMGI